MFDKASRMKGITGENLLQLCEARLDNMVYRFGISPSRRGARQLVSHKHITVNGEVVNIPSYTVRPGDVVSVREKSKSLEAINDSLTASNKKYDWLDWNNSSMEGKVLSLPAREMIPENIKEQLIVELYSK
jgi:small subunit ribosomal protein S4